MTPLLLLVDDSPTDEKLALRAFGRCGVPHATAVARDGAQALEMLLGEGAERVRPALVLLDLKMPRVDGFEVLRRLRAHPDTRHLPVVVLTASREEEDVARCYALGASGYVQKPLDHDDFVAAAAAVAAFWLRWNALPAAPGGAG